MSFGLWVEEVFLMDVRKLNQIVRRDDDDSINWLHILTSRLALESNSEEFD